MGRQSFSQKTLWYLQFYHRLDQSKCGQPTFLSTPSISRVCIVVTLYLTSVCVCVEMNGVSVPGVCLMVNPAAALFMSLSEH